jgi:hypothetical protein
MITIEMKMRIELGTFQYLEKQLISTIKPPEPHAFFTNMGSDSHLFAL